ncbi:endolytic transglycosylase MltG [Oribacterium sp. NK2B42]|uniref:endolytic transglycosylase MltG n=1 Tax=Oribacterium sp. NK2B42 TaxID=689781 RepID=UPI0003F5AB96|nr:endolytic transglycosylase MltG [Oribacterium sp. NK2B42]
MGHRDTLERVTGFVVGLAWRVILIALLVYGLTNGIKMAYSYGHGLLYDHAMAVEGAPEEEFVISEDQGVEDIAKALYKKKFIDNVEAFKVQSLLYEAKYVPGSYSLSKSMTTSDIIQHLTREGVKYQELQDKNLMDLEATTAAEEIETDANGVEVIGGSDDENMIAQDAANAAFESQVAESAAAAAGQ